MNSVCSLPKYRLFIQNYSARATARLALDAMILTLLFGLFGGRPRRTVLDAESAPPVSISARRVAAICRVPELPTPSPG